MMNNLNFKIVTTEFLPFSLEFFVGRNFKIISKGFASSERELTTKSWETGRQLNITLRICGHFD